MVDGPAEGHVVRIRKADVRDASAISVLVSDLSIRQIGRGFSEQGRARLVDSLAPQRIACHIDEGYLYLVAEFRDRIIGVAGVRACTHLYHLFVMESYQGQGIGRRLWKAVRETCRSDGSRRVFTVNSSIDARPFYEKLGFEARSGPLERHGVISVPMVLSADD